MQAKFQIVVIAVALTFFLSGCFGETATPVNTPGNTEGEPGAGNSEVSTSIVFTAPARPGQDFSNNIYVMEGNGENLRQLTESGRIGTAKYSPEAGIILYSVHYDAAAFHWYIMDVDGQNRRQLTGEPTICRFNWLPGDGLVYKETVSQRERERYIKVHNFKTGSEKQITAAPLHYENYSLAPGGREIWCLGGNPGGNKYSLLYKRLNDKEWKTAVEEVPFPSSTSRIEGWSPCGNYLVLWYYEENQNFLQLAERSNKGANLEFLDRVYQGKCPLWNEEDTRLAFCNREGIWTIKPGGEPRLFLPCEGVTRLLQWQGEKIIFEMRDGDKVTVAKTGGGEKEILTSVAAGDE